MTLSHSERTLAAAVLLDALSLGFRYPDSTLFGALADGRYLDTLDNSWRVLTETAPPSLQALRNGTAQVVNAGHASLESDYIALFEANRTQPPLRLYAHLYDDSQGSQLDLLARLQRAYQAQGLAIKSGADADQRDHLCVQLDFLALLYQRWHAALSEEDAQAAACREFSATLHWFARFHAALTQRTDHPFYTPLASLLLASLDKLPDASV